MISTSLTLAGPATAQTRDSHTTAIKELVRFMVSIMLRDAKSSGHGVPVQPIGVREIPFLEAPVIFHAVVFEERPKKPSVGRRADSA